MTGTASPLDFSERLREETSFWFYRDLDNEDRRNAGSRLISETSPALQLYYHYDSAGYVVAATDNTGKVRQNYTYNAWGQNSTIDTLGSKNKYKAMQGYTDPVTGFIYLPDGSYYNPVWGR